MSDRLRQLVGETLEVPPESVTDDAAYGTFKGWDSINHVRIIFAIEDAFGIALSDDEVMQLRSLAAIRACLAGRGVGDDESSGA